MSGVRVGRALLGVERAVVERVEFAQGEDVLVVGVRPGALMARQRGRCGVCRRRSRGYDQGNGRRRGGIWTPGWCRYGGSSDLSVGGGSAVGAVS